MKLNWYISLSNVSWKGGGKRGGRCAIKNNLILENCMTIKEDSENFLKIFKYEVIFDGTSAPLLPPLFKKVLIMKYINSVSFCTKNEVHKASRSIFTLILIWGDSQAKSMIFFDYEIIFYASFSHFLAKIEFFEIKALYVRI